MCLGRESVSRKPWGPREIRVERKELANFAKDVSAPPSWPTEAVRSPRLCESSVVAQDDRTWSYGRAGKEGILKALTTRDSLGLGPLDSKLLRVTISI